MAHSTDIVAYVYRADIYCPNCIVRVLNWTPMEGSEKAEQVLDDIAFIHGIDRQDESTFDSDNLPKVVFRDQVGCVEVDGYTDHTTHCGRCLEEIT